jgi:putative alpha-1,2-mannosidase
MGLFDVKGLTDPNPEFGIGSPLFDKISIELNQKYFPGKLFTIETNKNSEENCYINTIKLNGRKLVRPFLSFAEIVKGGKLVLDMSSVPKDDYKN